MAILAIIDQHGIEIPKTSNNRLWRTFLPWPTINEEDHDFGGGLRLGRVALTGGGTQRTCGTDQPYFQKNLVKPRG